MGFAEWFGLSGKRALIAGASGGLDREMALALAKAGTDIVITGRTQNTLDDTAAEIRALGAVTWPIKTDMAIPEECQPSICTKNRFSETTSCLAFSKRPLIEPVEIAKETSTRKTISSNRLRLILNARHFGQTRICWY